MSSASAWPFVRGEVEPPPREAPAAEWTAEGFQADLHRLGYELVGFAVDELKYTTAPRFQAIRYGDPLGRVLGAASPEELLAEITRDAARFEEPMSSPPRAAGAECARCSGPAEEGSQTFWDADGRMRLVCPACTAALTSSEEQTA